MQEFDFSVMYCCGSENIIADHVSRHPVREKRSAIRPESVAEVAMLKMTQKF